MWIKVQLEELEVKLEVGNREVRNSIFGFNVIFIFLFYLKVIRQLYFEYFSGWFMNVEIKLDVLEIRVLGC